MAKVKTLFLDSEYIGEFKNVDIEGGNVIVGKKYEHVVDDYVPIQLKGLMGSTPMYILKWSSIVPVKFKRVTKVISAEKVKQMVKDEGFVRVEYGGEQKEEKGGRKRKGSLRRWLKSRKERKNKQRENPNPYLDRPQPKYKTVTVSEPTHFEYRKLEVIDPKTTKSDIPPSLMKDTIDMRFLKNMKKYGEGKGGGGGIDKGKTILIAIGSMVFGVILFYLIFAYGGVV